MKSSIARTSFILLSMSLISFSAVAQNTTPVVDLTGANSTPAKVVQKPKAAVGDSYYQSQMLQNEVRELRGMVEQLSYELQRVKQRQMDDYLDIDRRLSALASAGMPADMDQQADGQLLTEQPLVEPLQSGTQAALQTTVQAPQDNAQKAQQKTTQNSEEIAENYAQASNLLLKKRDFDGAVAAFKQHVIDYPSSPYIANAHYWLGEIYLLQGQDEMARQAFTLVAEQHPTHSKASDANFKLGKIYYQLGELARARELLEKVAQGTGGAANKAQNYLKSNF